MCVCVCRGASRGLLRAVSESQLQLHWGEFTHPADGGVRDVAAQLDSRPEPFHHFIEWFIKWTEVACDHFDLQYFARCHLDRVSE